MGACESSAAALSGCAAQRCLFGTTAELDEHKSAAAANHAKHALAQVGVIALLRIQPFKVSQQLVCLDALHTLNCSAEHVWMLTKSCYQTQIEDQPFWRAHEPCMNHACHGIYRKHYGYNVGIGPIARKD